MPVRATKFTSVSNPIVDQNELNSVFYVNPKPIDTKGGESWNPFYDLSQWLTGGIDTLSEDLKNQVDGVLPTFNAGIEQANTWIAENYPNVMQSITDHVEYAKADFENWAKNEERKQKETWEEFAKAFGSGSGNISTFLSGAGIGSIVLLVLLAIVFLRGKT